MSESVCEGNFIKGYILKTVMLCDEIFYLSKLLEYCISLRVPFSSNFNFILVLSP